MTNGKQNAYTLIEILVALSIAGIIFGFGFVSFREFSRRQILAGAARSLEGDLRLTQQYSIIGKKPDDFKCSGTKTLIGYQFFVDTFATPNRYVIRASCTGGVVDDIKTVELASDISIFAPSPNPILFKALGEGVNINGMTTIKLSQSLTGNSIIVTITESGEIK